jgi:hypothetical protein
MLVLEQKDENIGYPLRCERFIIKIDHSLLIPANSSVFHADWLFFFNTLK